MEKIKLFVRQYPEFVNVADAIESIETLDGIKQQKIIKAIECLISYIEKNQSQGVADYIDSLKIKKQHHISEISDITGVNVSEQPCVNALEVALKHKTYKEAAHVINDIMCIKNIKTQITILSMIQ